MCSQISQAQDRHYYQTDFTVQEFQERRAKIFKVIGTTGIAIIQGARSVESFNVFRQTNTFYYLSGLETGHAYLLFNGKKKQLLFMYHIETLAENKVKEKYYLQKMQH